MEPQSYPQSIRRERPLSGLPNSVADSSFNAYLLEAHICPVMHSSTRTKTEKCSSTIGLVASRLASDSQLRSSATSFHSSEAAADHPSPGRARSKPRNVPQDILPDFQVLRRSFMSKLARALEDPEMEPVIVTKSESEELPIFDEFLSSPFSSPCETFESPSGQGLDPIMNTIDKSDGHPSLASAAEPLTLYNDSVRGAELPASHAGLAASSSHHLYVQHDPKPTLIRSSPAKAAGRNMAAHALIPQNAPTQPRQTSKPPSSDINVTFGKRSLTSAFDSDGENDDTDHRIKFQRENQDLPSDDESLPPAHPGPNATEKEMLEYKRRLSTLAARRSRRRKLEYKLKLEARVESLEREREKWKTRCTVLQEILKVHNADLKFEED
ncbi:hypothetical protein D9757_012204 [Collybiopsis confluens]|uniref:BZIP domain-containing protein n=1 Tax=Collybiopsis confluens TaxID=2823264 RepID=A0A8H5FUD8_9AGAR|nr:hypothetical protein D9757_012204 [Collybiopsis confluens]